MYHGCSNLNIGYSRVNALGKETSKSIKSAMIHLSQKLTHLEVMRTVWNFKKIWCTICQNIAELLRRYIERQDVDEEYFDTWQIEDKEIKKQSFWMIKDLKIKDNKETWNQASGVQVRGGLLGY